MALNLSGLKNKTKSNNLDLSGLLKAGIPSYGRLARTTPTAPTLNQFKAGIVPVVKEKPLSYGQLARMKSTATIIKENKEKAQKEMERIKSTLGQKYIEQAKSRGVDISEEIKRFGIDTSIKSKGELEQQNIFELSQMYANERVVKNIYDFAEKSASKSTNFLDGLKYGAKITLLEPEKLVPFAGSVASFQDLKTAMNAADKIANGEELTPLENSTIRKYQALNMPIDKGVGYGIGVLLTSMPTYAAEFVLTEGIFTGTRTAVTNVIGKSLVSRFVATIIAGGVQSLINVPEISEKTATYLLPNYEQLDNPLYKRAESELKDKNFQTALAQAIGTNAVEYITEQAGRIIEKPVDILKKAFLSKWIAKFGLESPEIINSIIKRIGWNGIIGEVFEEEVGEPFQQWIMGEEYKNFISTPEGRERLLTEILGIGAFGGISGVSVTAIQKSAQATNKALLEIEDIAKWIKRGDAIKGLKEQRGFAKIPFVDTGVTPSPVKTPSSDIKIKTTKVTPEPVKDEIKAESPLIQEAKKYKISEEFVKALKNPPAPKTGKEYLAIEYRGTGKDIIRQKKDLLLGEGLYTTPKKDFAKKFGDIEEVFVNLKNPYVITDANESLKIMNKESIDNIKKQGYDGIIERINGTETGFQTIQFNPSQLLTKSQLTDIWNKEQEKPKYREKGIGSEITGEEAIKNTRRVLKKLKISGVNYNKVDKILTGDGGEAIASSFGSDVNFTDIVSAFAGEHEVGHTYFKTLSKERQGAILQKMKEFYPNIKSNYDLEEELMINLEIYLNTKKTNQKGIIKSFFDEVMAFLHRVFSKNNLDIIHNFYREIEKGRGVFAKKIEIKRKTSPIITEDGKRVIDYTKYGNAKFQKTKDQEYDELSDEDKESLAQWQQQQIDEIRGAYEFDDEEMEIGYNNFVDALKKPKLFSKRELIETGDADRIKQIFIDAGIYKTKEDVGNALGFNNSEYSDDEVLEMIKDRIMEENPALLVGKKNILNLTGKPPTKSERKAIDEKIDVLDPEIKKMAEAYFRPPRNLNARAFNLLGNKDTTVPLFTSIFSRWVSNGIDTIIEPYARAFTLGSYSIKNAIRNGLKSYYANVYDIEKNIIIRAIADGNIDEVKLKLNSSVQKLNGLILDLSSKAKDGTYVVFSNFLKENKDSYIGSNAWKNYIRKEKIGKDVTVFKENYLKYKTIFDEAVKLMQNDDVNNLQSALDRAFIERIDIRGNELISKQIGFQSFEDKVFGKYGMTSGFDAIKETFDLAKEHGTTIDIGNGNENGWDFVNRINIADAQKTGFYFDPPYVKSSATYKGKEVSGEFLKEHFGNPDRFVSDHQKAFNSVKNGSRIVLTNDVHNDYIETILNEVPNDSFQVYKEGLTPTSLMSDIDTTGMITDFFATSYNSKAKEIWADMEYLAEAIKRGGYTEKTIKRLREHGVSEEIINILKIEDKYLKNLVKVKIEPNGEVSATISKEALAYINRTSKIKDLDKKWIKQYSLDYFKKGTFDTFQGYETGARFFLRIGKGFKNLLFDPIITGERLAAKQTEELKDRIKTVLSLTKKEAEDLFYFTASKQGKDVKAKSLDQLSDNTRKAYSEIRSVVRELYPEVKKVALKNGREIGEVENYSPLYTSDDYKLLDVGGFDFTRKDPFFGSIKERVEDVPIELYEKDYRKVMEAWINGVSRYINVGSRTLPIKYLIDSLELQEIAGKDIHSKLNEWYRNIVSPQQPKGVEKGLRFFRKLNAMGILAVKYTVIFKQFLNIADFWVLSSGVRLMKSPINIAKNSTIARLASMSGSVQQRGLGYEVADLRGIIIKWMRKPAEFTDQLTAKMGKIALMEQMIDRLHGEGKKINPKELRRIDRISDDIVDAVMGSMSKADQPAYFRSELGKAINMFYSQLNSKMQFYVTDIWKDPKMAEMSGSKKKLLAKSLVAILLAGWMEQLISKLYFDDPEDEVKDTIKGVIGNFPIIGSLMFALETGQPYSPSPILSNMIKLINAISQGKTEDIIWSAAGFVGFSSQIEDLIRGGYVVNQGGVYDKKGKKLFNVDSLPEQIRTILKGKWGSKAAQEYFEPTKTNKTKRKSSGLR